MMLRINMGCHVCEIAEKKNEKDLIFETDFWRILLSFNQRYLGRCFIFPKRHFGNMADITKEEVLDFLEVVKKLEGALRKAFRATMFNWMCLMNNFYQKENPNPHLHWHMKPRYREKVLFAGEIFDDGEFGHHYDDSKDKAVESKDMRVAIVKEIQKNL